MSKLCHIFFSVALLVSFSQVNAEEATGLFAGPSISLGVGYLNNNIYQQNVQSVSGTPSYDQPGASKQDVFGQLSAGYGYDLGQKFNVSIHLFYNFGNDDVDDIKATFFQDTVKQRIKNSAGIYIAPGYYIHSKALIFLKVGYVHADQTYLRKAQNINLDNSIEGNLWGIGVKYLVSDNIFIGADLTKYWYGKSKDSARLSFLDVNISSKVKQTSGLVSLGYQF